MKNISIFIIITLLYYIGVIYCIIDGDDTRIKYHPYQVSVHRHWQHVCGGVILDPTTVLTAAHCVQGYDSSWDIFSVRSGATFHDEGQEVIVHRIIQHEDYSKKLKNDKDIAILKLSRELIFGPTTRPILLLKPHQEVPPGTVCQVSGWGRYTEMNQMSLSLKVTKVTIIRNEECAEYFYVSSNMICATSQKCYLCGINCQQVFYGDSGGPLACTIDGKKRLVGIVSFGTTCKEPSCPGVYTRVAAFQDWIKQNAH